MKITGAINYDAMDTRLPAVASERGNGLHDGSSGQQAPEGLGVWAAESGALADLDCGERRVGIAANESSPMGGVRAKPSQMEQVEFEAAVWAAFAQCFLDHNEATAAIERHRIYGAAGFSEVSA